jgi:hypothetical protein
MHPIRLFVPEVAAGHKHAMLHPATPVQMNA